MLRQLKRKLAQLDRDQTGAMSIEKVLIVAVIVLPILIMLVLFRKEIIKWFEGQKNDLDQKRK